MEFIDISKLNITTDLDILKRDTQRYSSFLYQHKGVFFADNTRIGNNDSNEAKSKFINVLKKAKEENISLVLSPEYSCPKSVIDEIITKPELQPLPQKLWALGGESLNKVELNYFRNIQNPNIHIQFEDCDANSDKNYVDPLYYIFKGKYNGVDKLIILIQFKTWHMAGLWNSQIEPDNLIEGKTIYIIKNNDYSVRLMSFICSEAMNFTSQYEQELIQNHNWLDSPYLIFNIQFNPNPSHSNFIAFKQFTLSKERRELIALNWGLHTTIFGKGPLFSENNAPRSGIYFRTTDIELDHTRAKIIANHKKGLYFLQIKREKRVYFLNRETEIFRIHNKSVHITEGTDEQKRREGPICSNVYMFDSENNVLEINCEVSDNHIEFWENRGISNKYLLDSNTSFIDKEILLNISTGKVKAREGNKWSDIINLNSFILNESDECNKRLTYLEDTYTESETVRSNNCSSITELDINILPNNSLYPHSLKRLKYNDLRLAFSNDASDYNYRYNVVNGNGEIQKATICYLGFASDIDIEKTYDELQKLFEKGSVGIDTIVVYYKRGNSILNKSNPDAGDFTRIPTNQISITD
jgi:hypothetical protein